MLIESPPFETRHGKRLGGVSSLLTRFKLSEGHSAQTRVEVKVEFGLRAGLTIGQARKLFAVAKQKLDLEARFVVAVERQRIQVDIRAKEHRIPVVVGVHHTHHQKVTSKLHMVDHLMIQ